MYVGMQIIVIHHSIIASPINSRVIISDQHKTINDDVVDSGSEVQSCGIYGCATSFSFHGFLRNYNMTLQRGEVNPN